MFKKINIKAIRESLALLIIAAIVGTIVSFVAQLFIISAQNIYDFIFNNQNFILTISELSSINYLCAKFCFGITFNV